MAEKGKLHGEAVGREGAGGPAGAPAPVLPQSGEAGRYAVVIVAAGSGSRMGQDKVWLPLAGLPVVGHSLRAYAACPRVGTVVLVLAAHRLDDGRALLEKMGIPAVVVAGGALRQDSVMRGLEAVGEADLVAIHDGARPFVTQPLILSCFAAAERHGAAVAAVPVRDTVKRVDPDGWILETLPRPELWAMQTPQVFRRRLIQEAYGRLDREVTDDAAAVELLGHRVHVVPGDSFNLKITTREDLMVAEVLAGISR